MALTGRRTNLPISFNFQLVLLSPGYTLEPFCAFILSFGERKHFYLLRFFSSDWIFQKSSWNRNLSSSIRRPSVVRAYVRVAIISVSNMLVAFSPWPIWWNFKTLLLLHIAGKHFQASLNFPHKTTFGFLKFWVSNDNFKFTIVQHGETQNLNYLENEWSYSKAEWNWNSWAVVVHTWGTLTL